MKERELRHVYFFSLQNFPDGILLNPISHVFGENRIKKEMEKALESERNMNYNKYPSRLNCTFVASSEEAANEWCKSVNALKWKSQGYYLEYYVYELIGSPIFWFNADILMQIYLPQNVKSFEEISKEYWQSYSEKRPESTDSEFEGITNSNLTIISKKKMCLDRNRVFKELHI